MALPKDAENQPSEQYLIAYEKSPAYRHIPVSGVWGNATPVSINANFFFQQPTLPDATIHNSGDGAEVNREMPRATVTRTLEVGVSISVVDARFIANWLLEKVDEAERLRGGVSHVQ
jgi:hypothetical protein